MEESNIKAFYYYFDTVKEELRPISILSGDDKNGYKCVYKEDKDSDTLLIDKQDMIIIYLNTDTKEIYSSNVFNFVDNLRTAILDKGLGSSALKRHLQKNDKDFVNIIRIAAEDKPIKLSYQDKKVLNAAKTLGFKYVARYQTYNWSAFYELPVLYVNTYVEPVDGEGVKLTDFNPKVNLAKEREVYLIDDLLNDYCPIPTQMNDFSLDELEENNTGFNF